MVFRVVNERQRERETDVRLVLEGVVQRGQNVVAKVINRWCTFALCWQC